MLCSTLLLVTATLSSCKDYLDRSPEAEVSPTDAFISFNNFQGFVKDKNLAKELLEKANIEPSTRAQQCTLEDFIRLYEVTYEGTGKGKN